MAQDFARRRLPPPERLDRLLQELVQALLATQGDNLVSVVLYGSVARGDAHDGSDIDLLVVFRDLPLGRFQRYPFFHAATDRLRPTLEALWEQGYTARWSPVLKTVEEASYHSPLFLDMTLDAKMLFDRDGFFEGVLDEMRARMKELGSYRTRLSSGGWEWVLKPDYNWGELIEI